MVTWAMEAHVPPPGAARLAAQTKHMQTPEGLGDLEREMLRVSAHPPAPFLKKKDFLIPLSKCLW